MLIRTARICALVAMCLLGCRSAPPPVQHCNCDRQSAPQATATQTSAGSSAAAANQPPIRTVAYDQARASDSVDSLPTPSHGEASLSLPELVAEVQARNPSIEAMAAAWRAASQRYPQAVALDDPMFMAMTAPATLASNPNVESAYAFQVNQKFPWCGKRAARGRKAGAEADAAYDELQDSRLQLAELTEAAFFDYYLAEQQLKLNGQNAEVIREFHDTAQAKYRNNQVTQQDVLQSDVEVAQLERERIEFQRMKRLAVARINTLLLEPPYAALPPPPSSLDLPAQPSDVETLEQLAAGQRPDLAAASARVRAEQAALTLAYKDYYPDLEVFGRYDTFWQPTNTQGPLQGQVGVQMNVPIYRRKLSAAVCEAMSRVAQRRAEYAQKAQDIQYEVATAYEETEESRRTWQLYSEKLVPAAEQNVSAAKTNYYVSKGSFLDLAVAERQLIELRSKQQEALADYHRRFSQLQRSIGGPVAGAVETLPAPRPQ